MRPNAANAAAAIASVARGIGDVGRYRKRAMAGGDEFAGGGLCAGAVEVGEDHRRSILGQALGIRFADAVGRTGDDGDARVEARCHDVRPFFS